MKSRLHDLTSACVVICLGLFFSIGSLQYRVVTTGSVAGPGLLPLIAGLVLLAIGMTMAIHAQPFARTGSANNNSQSENLAREQAEDLSVASDAPTETEPGSSKKVWTAYALVFCALLATPFSGLLLAFGLLILLLLTVVERESPLLGLAVAAGATFIGWILFVHFLGIPVPTGFFGE